MNPPKVSVIIPCYNMEDYLMECLDSILSQSLRDIELLCINDGSTDRTGVLLDAVAAGDLRIRVLHQSNKGVSAARNLGIHTAAGEFVAFMDPDDFYPGPRTLELLYTKAVDADVLICGGAFSHYNSKTGRITTCFLDDYAKYSFRKEGYYNYRDYQFDFGYHRFLYKRTFLLGNHIFFPPYTRYQDPPFFVRAMLAAGRFYAVTDVVYRYRMGIQDHPTSWPSGKLQDMMRGHLENLEISSREKLSQLHALTLRRFESDEVFLPVMQSLQEPNEITRQLLEQINQAVNPLLLAEAGMKLPQPSTYTIRQLAPTAPQKASTVKAVTKKIRSLVKCWRDFGTGYTMRLIKEKIMI